MRTAVVPPIIECMKTTVDIPTALYRRSRSIAAARGVSFRTFLTEALQEKVLHGDMRAWTDSFGALSSAHDALAEVERAISFVRRPSNEPARL